MIQETKYRTVIQKIIKAVLLYSCMVLGLGLFVRYESNKLETSKLLLKDIQSMVQSSSRKLIEANAVTNKMQTFVHNAPVGRKHALSSHIKTVQHTINNLASRCKVLGPVNLKVSAPASYQDNSTSSIDLEILVTAHNEESIIRFTDELIKSFGGFVKIKKMMMAKPSVQQVSSNRRMNDLVSCQLKLRWYVLLKR